MLLKENKDKNPACYELEEVNLEAVQEYSAITGLSTNVIVNHCVEKCIDEYDHYARGFEDFDTPDEFFYQYFASRGADLVFVENDSDEYFFVRSCSHNVNSVHLFCYCDFLDTMTCICSARAGTYEGDNLETVYHDLIEISLCSRKRFIEENKKAFALTHTRLSDFDFHQRDEKGLATEDITSNDIAKESN